MSVSPEEEEQLNALQGKINKVLETLNTVTTKDASIIQLIEAMEAVTTNLSDNWQNDKTELQEILSDNKNYKGFSPKDKEILRRKLGAINSDIDNKLEFVPLKPMRQFAIGPGAVRGSGGKKRYKKQRSKRRKNKRNRKTIRRKH